MKHRLYKSKLVSILEIPEGFVSPREIVKMRDAVRKELVDGANKMVVDLGRSTHMNSMLVGALVEMYTSFANISGHILYAAPPASVRNLFHGLRLDQVFEVTPTVDRALALLEEQRSRASA